MFTRKIAATRKSQQINLTPTYEKKVKCYISSQLRRKHNYIRQTDWNKKKKGSYGFLFVKPHSHHKIPIVKQRKQVRVITLFLEFTASLYAATSVKGTSTESGVAVVI